MLRENRQILPLETAANWKVCVDNYLECYHCEPAHPTFCELMDVARTEIVCDGIVSRQYVPRTENWTNGAYPINPDDPVKDGLFWFLWPNTSIVSVPGAPNVFIAKFDPLAPERSRRQTHSFGLTREPTERETQRDSWASAFVGAEDVSLCESVQRGLRQRGYTQGRYIVDPDHHNVTEQPLHFFHTLYLSAMGERGAA